VGNSESSQPAFDKKTLVRLLRKGLETGASDIHFQVGYFPLYRFNGQLVELRYKKLTNEDTEAIAQIFLDEHPVHKDVATIDELDLAYEIPEEGRFRVNISHQRRTLNVVLRVIPPKIRTFQELNLPQILRKIALTETRGLVLVTGATGMGKSTTLATMIDAVNQEKKFKIVTIEDPIEFLFTHDKAVISQREVGIDTKSFPQALHAALRQDPDLVMVGEMRDLETVDTSLKAAETGHLVFSSIHTADVASTIGRLVGYFPPEEQLQVRARIAENLRAIISLRLLVNKKDDGRVPAVEIMQTTRAIQECIKDPAKVSEIPNYIARGRPDGMQTFDQHLLDLLHANKLSLETALAAATNPTDLQTQLELEGDNKSDNLNEKPDDSETTIDVDSLF